MGRIRIQPAGQRFKQKVEEWMQSLTDHDFDLLAARRDQLVGQLEALYRSVRMEMRVQT
jgi:DNA helicase TIP49 (TBP-interacting protein)